MTKSAALPIQHQSDVFPYLRPICLADKESIAAFNTAYKPFSCEYAFANLYCWRKLCDYSWCLYKNRLVIYNGVDRLIYMPLGEKMTPEQLFELSNDFMKAGFSGNVALAPETYIQRYPELERDYTIVSNRDLAEYIYNTRDLFELKGPRLHKKRNLISQFKRNFPEFEIEALSPSNLRDCQSFAESQRKKLTRIDRGINDENSAFQNALRRFDELDLEGIMLKARGKVAAFSIFSRLNASLYVTHFEKSDHDNKGAAQVINQATAARLAGKCEFINREQDLGLSGLRQAKMSYGPAMIYSTHTLIP